MGGVSCNFRGTRSFVLCGAALFMLRTTGILKSIDVALAAGGVRMLYRDEEGYTQAVRAADTPGVSAFIAEGAQLGHSWLEGHLGAGDPLVNSGAPVKRGKRA